MAFLLAFLKAIEALGRDVLFSPYLFVLVMEFWSLNMDISIASGTVSPLRRNSKLVASHLLFADDMLVFSRGDKKSAMGSCLKKHELFTGLAINKQKRNVFFSKGCKHKEEISESQLAHYQLDI